MNEDKVKEAYRELAVLLAENPKLRKIQAHIGMAMNEADPEDPMGRIKILLFYMADNIEQLAIELTMLNIVAKEALQKLEE